MMNKNHQSRHFLRGLPLYDIYFTTKSYGVSELKELGCPVVEFSANAYDPHTHKPYKLSETEKERWGANVGFIGTFEKDRFQQMLSLADEGVEVRVIGSFWERVVSYHPKLKISCGGVIGADYAKAICATKINLGFLRKGNRDKQTQRSIEIPACGGFMLAERTDEHLELFEEGKEVEFFGSKEELLDKVKYYLSHDDKRKMIARAGRERCLKSGYSYHDRLKEAINKIMNLRKL
jgi:spore maturation protein CgeB